MQRLCADLYWQYFHLEPRGCRLLTYVILAMVLGLPSVMAQSQRVYRVDDTLEAEEVPLQGVTVAPDGQSVAFTKLRARHTQPSPLHIPDVRSDVWVQDGPGRTVKNVTNGLSDRSGWWAPQWSPDGQRLAFLSSRGGGVTLWAWERRTNAVRQIDSDGVEFEGSLDAPAFRWIDRSRVLYLGLSEGEPSLPMRKFGGRAAQYATDAWAKAARGELTASVVDSLEFQHPHRRLILVDVTTGERHVVAKTRTNPDATSWWLSPNGQTVVFLMPDATHYSAVNASATPRTLGTLSVSATDGRAIQLDKPLPRNVATRTLRWSTDSKEVAFWAWGDVPIEPMLILGQEATRDSEGRPAAPLDNPARLWRVNIAEGRVSEVDVKHLNLGRTLELSEFVWTASGELLIRAVPPSSAGTKTTAALAEWMLLAHDGRTRALLPEGARGPESLETFDDGATFVGVLNGELLQVDPTTGKMTSLTENLVPAVRRTHRAAGVATQTSLVISAVKTPETAEEIMRVDQDRRVDYLSNYYLLDLATGQAAPLAQPAPRTAVVDYHPTGNNLIWHADDRLGTRLWRTTTRGAAEPLLVANAFRKDVITGEQRTLDYTTLNGEAMQARVTLPPGYQAGRRYPVVVDFDIGYTPDDSSLYVVRDDSSFVSGQESLAESLVAAGYVYLFTSWPSTSMDNIGRANLLLGLNGVMPAVNKVIDLGIGDPDRLFVFGVSSAGYGAYGLITQTNRFKAAAVSAGWVDSMTMNLLININKRYSAQPFEDARMGAPYIRRRWPVWSIADLVRRNSPLSYVDRVQTPVLILHGDLDVVGIEQPEMFFQALVMQRKRARFVRYFGEWHGMESPLNHRDFFRQIFAWFDEHGDILRDSDGNMVFEADRVKSRNGAPALTASAFARFGPAAEPGTRTSHGSH